MFELVQSAAKLKTSPTGETIPGKCKLLLMILITEGGGERLQVDSVTLSSLMGLTHPRSITRLLKTLSDMRLITIEQGRGKDGKWIPTYAYPLPGVKRQAAHNIAPGNNIVSGTAHNIVSGEPTAHNIVSGLSIDENEGLPSAAHNIVSGGRGTIITFKSPSPSNNINLRKEREGEVELGAKGVIDHPAVKAWLEIMQENIALESATYISNRVTILPAWREVLEGWKATPNWNNQNIAGQIERYQKTAKTYEPPPEKARVKDPVEEERIRRIMYGE